MKNLNVNPVILVIMFGGTTTKIAIFEGDKCLAIDTIRHSLKEMESFETVWDQYEVRKYDITEWVSNNNYNYNQFEAIVSSSALVRPSEPGVYEINQIMVEDSKTERYGIHTSNLGAVLCYDLGKENNVPVLTVDPSTDVNMMSIAKYSGHPLIERPNSYHVLNQKAQATRAAEELGKKYEDSRIIVAHIGSGTTVGAHLNGKVIDVNNGIESDGPFSSVRTGALPVGPLVDLCFSGDYTRQEMHNMLGVTGGLAAYLGTSDGLEIEEKIDSGDEKADEVVHAMAYQVAKEVGARAVSLKGEIDAVVITGGLANWDRVTNYITDWTKHIAQVFVYPGENELESLASGVVRYFRGEEELKIY